MEMNAKGGKRGGESRRREGREGKGWGGKGERKGRGGEGCVMVVRGMDAPGSNPRWRTVHKLDMSKLRYPSRRLR